MSAGRIREAAERALVNLGARRHTADAARVGRSMGFDLFEMLVLIMCWFGPMLVAFVGAWFCFFWPCEHMRGSRAHRQDTFYNRARQVFGLDLPEISWMNLPKLNSQKALIYEDHPYFKPQDFATRAVSRILSKFSKIWH